MTILRRPAKYQPTKSQLETVDYSAMQDACAVCGGIIYYRDVDGIVRCDKCMARIGLKSAPVPEPDPVAMLQVIPMTWEDALDIQRRVELMCRKVGRA